MRAYIAGEICTGTLMKFCFLILGCERIPFDRQCLTLFIAKYKKCASGVLKTLLVFFLFLLVSINHMHLFYNTITT